ncbi:DUF4870 domain-containing protein [Streptomonospora salina]|uniref:Putative Tic20 family protein n=1 Tax=Streptomonospora salina TaxID=104205 RepID=A0A841E401_9ACTN|nr:DUF4870 domain-containing protein [Streptomonospora salina]MBB5997164.1 putative Tic20 family protein [Streptomonospora salina]
MSYPPQPDEPYGGQPDHPGGYGPPPGVDPQYGPQSGPQPGYGQGYPGQPHYPAQMPGYQQPGGHYPPSSDDRTLALVAHLGGIFTSWILPLILYLVKKDESPYVRHQAAQAFNFQMTMFIAQLVSYILMILIVGFLTIVAVFACAIAFGVIAAVASNKGEWYTYPKMLAIPMLS